MDKNIERMNGDDVLSSFTRRMWMLTYSCLLKFECPVIFKITGPDVPRRLSQYIEFFVPAQHSRCSEIMEYLREELKDDVRSERDVNGEFWFGTYVQIHEYSGLESYLEREECRKLAENMVKSLLEQMNTPKTVS